MPSDFNTIVTLGVVFQICDRNLNPIWNGDLDTICRQMVETGHPIKETWASVDTEVRVSRASAPLSASVGKKVGSEFNNFVLSLKKLVQAADKADTYDVRLVKSLNPLQLKAYARLSGAMGIVSPLNAIRSIMPAILNDRDEWGMTVVAWACAAGHASIAQYAAEQGADLNCTNMFSLNYCDLAHANKHKHLVTELIRLGAKPPQGSLTARMKRYGIPITPRI